MPRINEIAFFFRSAVINDDQSSEIGIGNCARDLHMSSLHALSARTYIHISFLCIDGAAIIARIPFRRHLLTPKGKSQGNGGVEQIWVMWHIIRRISLMQIYGPGSGLTRVFSCLTFFFFFFFFFCTTLSCHVTENIIITIANCRTGERSRDRSISGDLIGFACELIKCGSLDRENPVAVAVAVVTLSRWDLRQSRERKENSLTTPPSLPSSGKLLHP